MIYDYEYFKKEIYSLTTIDLNAYKEKQMKRRIDTLIAKHKIVGYDKYVQALKTDRELFEEFVGYITINVSEFYRNPEQWKYLDETVIPELIQRFGKNLKIWSAACSTGDEPYSLVMALSRHVPLQQIHIYATDLDKQVIAKAKTGLYNEKSIEGVPEDLKKKYTVIVVTHNMQQATRVSDQTAFFLVGEMVEFGDTKQIFSYPQDKRTEDYITGRFG